MELEFCDASFALIKFIPMTRQRLMLLVKIHRDHADS
jgi:hypothetical protein